MDITNPPLRGYSSQFVILAVTHLRSKHTGLVTSSRSPTGNRRQNGVKFETTNFESSQACKLAAIGGYPHNAHQAVIGATDHPYQVSKNSELQQLCLRVLVGE